MPLRVVLKQLLSFRRDLEVKIHVLADRPTFEVEEVLEEFRSEFWGLHYLNFPILSLEHGEQFREAKRLQYELIKPSKPDWVLLQDDDRAFEQLGIEEELLPALENPNIDLWYANSLFLWDDMDHVNLARFHNSPVLFRHQPGCAFPLDRDIQAPLPLHDHAVVRGRAAQLRTPILDCGTLEETERRRVYQEFIRAGKADDYVNSLVGPPEVALLTTQIRRPLVNPFAEEAQ